MNNYSLMLQAVQSSLYRHYGERKTIAHRESPMSDALQFSYINRNGEQVQITLTGLELKMYNILELETLIDERVRSQL